MAPAGGAHWQHPLAAPAAAGVLLSGCCAKRHNESSAPVDCTKKGSAVVLRLTSQLRRQRWTANQSVTSSLASVAGPPGPPRRLGSRPCALRRALSSAAFVSSSLRLISSSRVCLDNRSAGLISNAADALCRRRLTSAPARRRHRFLPPRHTHSRAHAY